MEKARLEQLRLNALLEDQRNANYGKSGQGKSFLPEIPSVPSLVNGSAPESIEAEDEARESEIGLMALALAYDQVKARAPSGGSDILRSKTFLRDLQSKKTSIGQRD